MIENQRVLVLDGVDHDAAAELLLVVEHVVYTALEVLDDLRGRDTELVDEDIVNGVGAVLGEHEVVVRGSGLLVGIAADEVLGVRGALDEVGDALEVDHLTLGDVPLVDYEVDVEPDLGDVLDVLDGFGVGEAVAEVVVGCIGVSKGLGQKSRSAKMASL